MNWIQKLFEKPKDKFEFIEDIEEGEYGNTTYYTRKNGSFVTNSLSRNKSVALKLFNRLSNGEKLETKIVLETKYL